MTCIAPLYNGLPKQVRHDPYFPHLHIFPSPHLHIDTFAHLHIPPPPPKIFVILHMQSAYHKYNAKFQEALSTLNPQQLAAVNKMDGPVLVIAGPGTGKTQILAARIGKILTETDALPHEILCLTYTDAGAVAMRKRLFDFIGPDAYRVNIYTFHAFCNEVIQENLEYFGKMKLA